MCRKGGVKQVKRWGQVIMERKQPECMELPGSQVERGRWWPLLGCGQRGEQMEHGIVWEESGCHFIVGETGAQRKEELRLEAGAWDRPAQRTCACMCVGLGLFYSLEGAHLRS